MSTVLWANLWVDGVIESQEEDLHALYAHQERLEAIAERLQLPSFRGLCDTTDVRFNLDELELPENMVSTNELMARDGMWLPLPEAVVMLEQLLAHITQTRPRFGLFSNAYGEVVRELESSLAFARSGVGRAQRFNFCVVT